MEDIFKQLQKIFSKHFKDLKIFCIQIFIYKIPVENLLEHLRKTPELFLGAEGLKSLFVDLKNLPKSPAYQSSEYQTEGDIRSFKAFCNEFNPNKGVLYKNLPSLKDLQKVFYSYKSSSSYSFLRR